MRFVRVTATYKEDGILQDNFKIVVLCLTENERIAKGEWFGYVQNESVKHPFVLHNGIAFAYGDKDNISEPTNIGAVAIAKGETFTLTSSSRLGSPTAYNYEITHVHTYDG